MRRLREDNPNSPEFYDGVWAREGWHHWDTVRMEALTKHIKESQVVIDLGCGWYSPALWWMTEWASRDLHPIFVDFSPVALAKVKADGGHGIFLEADCRNVPLPDAIADVVIAGEIIEHMDDPAAFVAEQARLCKPGGWMTMSTVNPKCADAIAHGEYKDHVWEFAPTELWGMYRKHGAAEYRLVGNYHFVECQRR